MAAKRKGGGGDEPVTRAAAELVETLHEMEVLTARVSKVELVSRGELLRAGDLLQQAAEGHTRFLQHLTELSEAIGELRDRQNASADELSRRAEELDERRRQHEGLEKRFAELGGAAQEIGNLLEQGQAAAEGAQGQADPGAMRQAFGAAAERLAPAVDEAAAIAADARELGFVELDRQAHGLQQQLTTLLRKLQHLRTPPP